MKKKEIVVIDCVDKKHITSDKCDLLPTGGEKWIFAGRSGSGKGVAVKNIIGRLNPPPERIVVVHHDPKGTDEWDDLDPVELVGIDEIPENDSWDRTKKNVLIVDEAPLDSLSRADRSKMERFANYTASHKNCMLFVVSQNLVSIPTPIRRAADYLTIWPSVDRMVWSDLQRKTGHDVKELFKLCKSKFDSITFNFSDKPHPLRFNLFTPIEDEEE